MKFNKMVNHLALYTLTPLRVFLFICLSICLFFGCTRQVLTVQTEFLSHENLASYHVRTPDPRLWNPPIGQRLLINWRIPVYFGKMTDLKLVLKLRFYDHTEKTELIEVAKPTGIYIYSLLNEEYCEKKGILTYKAQLWSGNHILDEWRHQLWVELITLQQDSEIETEKELR